MAQYAHMQPCDKAHAETKAELQMFEEEVRDLRILRWIVVSLCVCVCFFFWVVGEAV